MRTRDYSAAADAVIMVQALLSQRVYGHEDEIKILHAIQIESQIQMEKLTNDLSEKWRELIVWTVPDDKVKEGTRKTELKLNIKEENSMLLDKVVLGMKKIKILDDKMKRFSERLLVQVIEPLMKYSACEILDSETSQAKVLTLVVTAGPETPAPAPLEMYAHLDKVLRFLNPNLLYVVVGEGITENDPPVTLMNKLGSLIADQTLTLAVKECLIRSIPTSNKELEDFNSVIAMTEEAHKQLVSLRFIEPDNKILLDFIGNVNVLFANKKCQEILEKARGLMTTEVHNTTVVSHDKPLGKLPSLGEGTAGVKKAKRDDLAVDSPLSVNTFRLPKCHIR